QFDQAAVELTVWGMSFYSLGLYFLAARDLLTRAFYALENTRTPVMIGVIGIVVYIATAWSTMPTLGHGGVALSASVSALSQSLLLFIVLWRKIGSPVSISFI
ncbi:polysaccharide biosynthesis C-terminal domain-containing protein, partial [Microbacteriaceae bacterium K1510]|nr:polysaccharide biosynthesis C-terminal domain-containing protein [Microbacteriaceae bacterium K1510]